MLERLPVEQQGNICEMILKSEGMPSMLRASGVSLEEVDTPSELNEENLQDAVLDDFARAIGFDEYK